jgi:outer membrane protein assembly factor BamB
VTPTIPIQEWTAWRGPKNDGRVLWLPDKLPTKPKILWEKRLSAKTLGGVAATRDFVLFSDRELNDTTDVFYCLDAKTGKDVWSHSNPAPGNLDYGNAPRATPLIHGDLVFLANAFGYLACLELKTGKVVWEKDLRDEFKATDIRKWGECSNPLLADGKLIVNPGGKDASLVALDPKTGKLIWKTPGKPASYGNFIVATFAGKRQVVGHDLDSFGGWDLATGKRLWEVVPPRRGDFNVPTPIQVGEQLLVTSENNGTRLYRFKAGGVIDPVPIAHNNQLAPDTHSPVVVGARVFGIHQRMHCLDLKNDLKPIWTSDDDVFARYASILATDERVLVVTLEGEVLLLDARADKMRELGRWRLFGDEQAGYAHPALVGSRLYLRGNASIICIELNP